MLCMYTGIAVKCHIQNSIQCLIKTSVYYQSNKTFNPIISGKTTWQKGVHLTTVCSTKSIFKY